MLVEQRQENQTQRFSYSAFSLDMVRQRFTIEIHLQRFFAHIPRVDATELLRASLARASTVALLSEKARSEFIVAPILLELKEILENRSVFIRVFGLMSRRWKGCKGYVILLSAKRLLCRSYKRL